MKEYEISIVTPFHDVDEEVFVNGIKSMRSQSIGFGNVEWIVVIHNSTNAHKEYVHRYLDEYENVKVYDLDNDRKTPSSPRNYGLKHATGRYVGFLDADDSYTRLCLEKVLSVIKKYDAQVVSFRREYGISDDRVLCSDFQIRLSSRFYVFHQLYARPGDRRDPGLCLFPVSEGSARPDRI